jgi:glycosyltransferase involved in cell wall biosynthesis
MKTIYLSVVLSTRNEEENIGPCLDSVSEIADEVIIMDESSSDRTVQIARQHGAKVFTVPHREIFHITKQEAIDKAHGTWILQLDADERVSPELAKEIASVIRMTHKEILNRPLDSKHRRLFERNLRLLEKRDGPIGKQTGEIVAFFVPRVNFFVGAPLIHAGVYPDGAIRLIRKGKAFLPAKDVHEIMTVNGEVAWLHSDLEHHDSPTIRRYLSRLNRYTTLHRNTIASSSVPKNFLFFVKYTFITPVLVFMRLYFRHKGFLDGIRGFLWSAFSALHYPIAYYKYWTTESI